MRKLTNTLFALVAMLFACAQMDAQQIVCPATGPMPDEQAINTTVTIDGEQPVTGSPVSCTYSITVMVETVSGNDATQDITVDIIAESTSPSIMPPITTSNSITLFDGSDSRTVTVTSFPLPCGLAFDYTIQVVGGSNCLGTSFFPVELTKFKATSKNDQIQLNWETASELENQGFEIERSREGKKWETLGFVKGAGTTSEVQRYEWMDVKPYPNKLNYYRLKQMDFDGTTEYSAIIVAELTPDKEEIIITPNPAKEFLNIQLGELEKEARVEIYNSSGQLVRSLVASRDSATIELNISDLPSSIYWVKIAAGKEKQQQKFVKL
ncbi:MAG: T9SS type A sorting domain-containing protein [Bacteroidota bacterium]